MSNPSDPSLQFSQSPWIHCLVVIRFDLELGQVVDYVLPPGSLTPSEEKEISFLGFPDSNTFVKHDCIYAVRTKSGLNGCVYFRQKRDASCPRGVVQHSLVLLSIYPFIALHEDILRILSSYFFQRCELSPEAAGQPRDVCTVTIPVPTPVTRVVKMTDASLPDDVETQREVLELCWTRDVLAWPELTSNQSYELPLLGTTLRWTSPALFHVSAAPDPNSPVSPISGVRCSGRYPSLQFTNTPQRVQHLLGSLSGRRHVLSDIPLFTLFHNQLEVLPKLWELLIANESILVLSPHPSVCTGVILGLCSLVLPMQYQGSVHPYFTVQDTNLSVYSQLGLSTPTGLKFSTSSPILVGCTNPYFAKAMTGWSNFLCISGPSDMRNAEHTPDVPAEQLASLPPREKVMWKFSDQFFVNPDFKFVLNDSQTNLKKLLLLSSPTKSHLGGVDMVNNETIRRHFINLTLDFLAPLQQCFDEVWSSMTSPLLLPDDDAAIKAVFPAETFLEYIQKNSSSRKKIFKMFQEKGVIRLYERFLRGDTFKSWLRDTIFESYRNDLLHIDMCSLVARKGEVHIMDLFLKLFSDWVSVRGHQWVVDEEVETALEKQLFGLASALPSHLAETLRDKIDKQKMKLSMSISPLRTNFDGEF